MATTNLLQWNPNATNQEDDAAYLADSQRTGGAADPSIFDSVLANKLFFQCTTYLTALFTAFANKGFPTSDANLATLTAQCANFLTTADTRPGLSSIAYSATPIFNALTADGFQVTLTGNITSLTLNNLTFGQRFIMAFVQDGGGGHGVTFPTNVKTPGAVSGVPGATSIQPFVVLLDGNLYPTGPMVVV